MPPTFSERVARIVLLIPEGRVTTYGLIALAMGAPGAARQVGHALNRGVGGTHLPAHRVVNRHGYLSGGWHFGHPEVMKGLLEDERVAVSDEYVVDLEVFVWDPSDAPEVHELLQSWNERAML